MQLRNNFLVVTEQKRLWPGALYGSTAEMLTIFALGIVVCAVLYTACAFYEGALERRKESRTAYVQLIEELRRKSDVHIAVVTSPL
jgi:hypothetical protein